MLVALSDGKHVEIALYKEYCGCGIGRAMMETILDIVATLGYEQAELEVEKNYI